MDALSLLQQAVDVLSYFKKVFSVGDLPLTGFEDFRTVLFACLEKVDYIDLYKDLF
jgi:hypothetical protein